MTNRIAGGIVVVVMLAVAACAARESDTYYGIDTAGQNIVFVVDVSGSMAGRSEGVAEDRIFNEVVGRGVGEVAGLVGGRAGRILRDRGREATTALASAKRELVPALRGLTPASRFNVVMFGARSASRPVEAWQDDLVPATEENRAEAVRYVQALEAWGGTPARQALERAFEHQEVQMIFFLSDGIPTDARGPAIVERVRELNQGRGVIVHTIGLGDHLDEDFMRELALSTDGVFVRR